MKKLTLSALKKSAENVLTKDELKTIKGGQECVLDYPPNTTGYVVICYEGFTALGYACTGGNCGGEQYGVCSNAYPYNTITYADCLF